MARSDGLAWERGDGDFGEVREGEGVELDLSFGHAEEALVHAVDEEGGGQGTGAEEGFDGALQDPGALGGAGWQVSLTGNHTQ